LIYFKKDTTLVTGRIIQYNKKNKPNKFVLVTKGKVDELGWQSIYNDGIIRTEESTLGTLLLGAGAVLEMTNTINIPESRKRHFSDPNIDNYRKYNKEFIKKEAKELSDRKRIFNNHTSNEISNLDVAPKDGFVKEFYDNKQVKSKGNYVKGKKHGAWENYYLNGNLKSKTNYIDGNRDGSFAEYYENGQLKAKRNFVKLVKEGVWETYHDNGKLKVLLNYVNGKEDGLMEVYHKNGQLILKGYLKNGKQIGEWKTYNKTGKLIKSENFG